MPEEEMLRVIVEWTFTDEKWWDIVGPASYRYCKADSKMEAKMQNQVSAFYFFVLCIFSFFVLCVCVCNNPGIKSKRAT